MNYFQDRSQQRLMNVAATLTVLALVLAACGGSGGVFSNACSRWAFPFCAECCLISTKAALMLARMESVWRLRESARMLDSAKAARASVWFCCIACACPRSLRIVALEEYRPYMMVVTFSFLGAAFYFTYRPKRAPAGEADCCAPAAAGARRLNMMTMNKIMLWGVTAMAVVFLFFPQFVTGLMAPDAGEFTADMDRTVLHVEGMTCLG